MTVRELLSRIESRELAEWMAFFRVERAEAETPTPADRIRELRLEAVDRGRPNQHVAKSNQPRRFDDGIVLDARDVQLA